MKSWMLTFVLPGLALPACRAVIMSDIGVDFARHPSTQALILQVDGRVNTFVEAVRS